MDGNRPHLFPLKLLVLAAVMITGVIVLSASGGLFQSAAIIIAIAKWMSERRQPISNLRERIRAAKVNGPSCDQGIGMKTVAIVSILIGFLSIVSPARAAGTCKECRDFQKACLKAHSKAACQTDYSICMKHCRQK